ncbi:Translationally-controlled tumor protein [Orchesella cincta]|uniref:Translationally-controlled tumor protein homolog n=1 Tax=Orchesella cincta TaxID=48709 RepID=A0A1D2N6E4_ORCCI|nr:Translationally-controlled tumor protein [Orchesella cincta]
MLVLLGHIDSGSKRNLIAHNYRTILLNPAPYPILRYRSTLVSPGMVSYAQQPLILGDPYNYRSLLMPTVLYSGVNTAPTTLDLRYDQFCDCPIFKDVFTDDEIFSNAHKIQLVDEVMYEVHGKFVTRKNGVIHTDDASLSSEETDWGTYQEIDIVLNHHLEQTFFEKKGYTAYLKDYMNKVVERLQKESPDQVDVFKTNITKVLKGILDRFEDLEFYTGKSMDLGALVAVVEYKEVDGEHIPVLYAFKHGLYEEIKK